MNKMSTGARSDLQADEGWEKVWQVQTLVKCWPRSDAQRRATPKLSPCSMTL